MYKTMYICLLVLFGIFSQGICVLSEEDGNSEDLHIRQKRVIGSRLIYLQNAPYVINILANGVNRCPGSLLSHVFAITAYHCFNLPQGTTYSILSGSSKNHYGASHNITEKIHHPDYRADDYIHDIVLVKFLPPVNSETSRNSPIKLYNGPLPPNSYGTIVSWGCHRIHGEDKEYPYQLRSAVLKIISLTECRHHYGNSNFLVTDHYICTGTENGKLRCDDGDSGAPLVVNDKLVGVMSWGSINDIQQPDVFVSMLHHEHRTWIARYVPSAL